MFYNCFRYAIQVISSCLIHVLTIKVISMIAYMLAGFLQVVRLKINQSNNV